MGTGLAIEPHKERHLGRWVVLLIIAALLLVAGWYAYKWYTTGMEPPVPIPVAKADPTIDESDVSQVDISSYNVPADHPRYISISALNVSKARIYPVGLDKNNLLDTPRNINDAAWYTKSATPGNGYGAVLIDGHNGGMTKNGIFAKLNTLKPGDTLTVERGDGKKFDYQVVENKTMSLDEVNATGMKTMMQSADSQKEGLNLITCAGKWIPRLQQFDQRIMLRATLIE